MIKEGIVGIKNLIVGSVRGFFALFTIIVLVIMYTPVANRLAETLVVPAELKEVELIAVLGGGAYKNSILSGRSNERMIHGIRLYKAGLAPRILFTGATITDQSEKVFGTIKGTRDPSMIDVAEASIMRDIAVELGLPEEAILLDETSTNTHDNLVAVKRLMDEEGLGRCLVVTSPTHIYRAIRVCDKLGLDCLPAPVGDYTPYVETAVGRLVLMRRVAWEYAALLLYKVFGYI